MHAIFDIDLRTPDGGAERLKSYLGRPLLLVLLRHLACIPCQKHVQEIKKHKSQFDEANCRVILVSFASRERVETYLATGRSPFSVLGDSERRLYRALDLKRGAIVNVFSPRTLLAYLGFASRGEFPEKPTEDILQLGGDFLFDSRGEMTYSYRSQTPVDRPPTSALLGALKQI